MAASSESSVIEEPPFKCPKLPSVKIQNLITKCETIALKNNWLITYEPKPQIITENNMKYNVCLAENLANKPNNNNNKDKNDKTNKSKPFDPFSGPFITGAHICDLGEKNEYRLILNKFPVLPNHILIVSSDWIQQTDGLNKNDFDITLKIFKSLLLNKQNENSLIFINSGIFSGATQMHRHLHCIPNSGHLLLLNQIAKTLKNVINNDENHENEEKKQENDNNNNNDGNIKIYDGFSFLHGMVLLDDNIDSDKLNGYYQELLEWIKNKMVKDDNIDNDYLSENKFSYNLLITQYIMMIVARKCGVFEGELNDDDNNNKDNKMRKVKFAINALPFAGLIFCSSHDQIKLYKKIGITAMIKHCTFPTKN